MKYKLEIDEWKLTAPNKSGDIETHVVGLKIEAESIKNVKTVIDIMSNELIRLLGEAKKEPSVVSVDENHGTMNIERFKL